MPEEKIKSNLIYFTDYYPANKALKRLLNKLRKDEIRVFVLAFIGDEDEIEYYWFSKDPSYRALGLTGRLQHKINRFLDRCEEIIEEDIDD